MNNTKEMLMAQKWHEKLTNLGASLFAINEWADEELKVNAGPTQKDFAYVEADLMRTLHTLQAYDFMPLVKAFPPLEKAINDMTLEAGRYLDDGRLCYPSWDDPYLTIEDEVEEELAQ